MTKETLNKRCKIDYIVFALFSLICIVAIVCCLIHPRGRYICITLILMIGWMMSLKQILPRRRNTKAGIQKTPAKKFSLWMYPVVMGSIFLVLYLPFGMEIYAFEYIFSTRWPYEYEAEIKELKESGYYPAGIFPEELPESAKDVQWNVVPGLMQAHGFRTLSFVAEEEDIKQCTNEAIQWFKKDYMDLFGIDPAYKEGDYEKFLQDNVIKTYDYAHGQWPVSVPEKVHFTEEELVRGIQYDFSFFSKYRVGIVVMEDTNRIVYFAYLP